MKRYLLLLITLFIFSSSHSQSLIPIDYGIKAGASLTNNIFTAETGVSPPETSYLFNYQAGIFMKIALTDKLFISPEIIYSEEGGDYSFEYRYPIGNTMYVYNLSATLDLTYVRINPYINYKANDRISLNISPSFAYLIKSAISSSSNDPLFTQINNEELEESNSLDIGLLTGVDFYVTENLFINTSVCTGFFPIESDENDSYSAKNISYILSLGYIF